MNVDWTSSLGPLWPSYRPEQKSRTPSCTVSRNRAESRPHLKHRMDWSGALTPGSTFNDQPLRIEKYAMSARQHTGRKADATTRVWHRSAPRALGHFAKAPRRATHPSPRETPHPDGARTSKHTRACATCSMYGKTNQPSTWYWPKPMTHQNA